MDSGWAVVIGALVGSAASIIAAVLGPYWTAKREHMHAREEQRRDDIRTSLTGTIDGLSRMMVFHQHGQGTSGFLPTLDSITRLGLAIDSVDGPIEDLALKTMHAVQHGSLLESSAALGAFQTTAHAWYRGDIHGDQIYATFAANKAQGEAFDAARAAAGDTGRPLTETTTENPRHAD